MDSWLDQLRRDLAQLDARQQLRRLREVEPAGPLLRVAGREVLNLASNDYLGLSQHPRLRAAAVAAVERFGTGSTSSRLLGGHLGLHQRVEDRFARFKQAEAALLFPTGYMANHGALTALAGRGDLICLDKRCHASLIDAARASGAEVRTFPHLDYARARRVLARRRPSRASAPDRPARSLLVSDSVFSMDGDVADLPALCELADQYDAILVVDEAHGTGVLGPTGAGLCELQGVAQRVDVVVSTASKALAGLGGIVTARREVIQTLVNRARAFIYTTAVPPTQAAVLEAALDVLAAEPQRRRRLGDLAARLRGEVTRLGWPAPGAAGGAGPAGVPVATPIVPLITGSAESALALAQRLWDRGVYAPAIRPPSVAPGKSRVRLSLRADLQDAHLDRLGEALTACRPPAGAGTA